MRLYCTHFNFCTSHRELKNKEGVLENKTPAQECRITNKNGNL